MTRQLGSDRDRLALHLLKRLRHRLAGAALDRAVDADILIAATWDVDGVQVRGFTAHPMMLQRSPLQIERLVARLGSREAPSRSAAVALMDFDDDTYVVAENGIRPLNKAAGKRKRGASEAAVAGGGNARYRRLTTTLLRKVRRSASRPQAAEVATLLLVARAAADSGIPLREILRVLRLPGAIVTLTAAVPGFEGTFLDLLARGLVLPGAVTLASGYELSGGRTARFTSRNTDRWRTIVFPGIKYDPEESDNIDKQVGRAALMEHPILGVAESADRLPQRLFCAAQLKLSTGPLDMGLVRQVIAAVLGEKPRTCLPDELCARLTLFDLAIAVRPGAAADHAIDVLMQLAGGRLPEAAAADGAPGGGRKSAEQSSSWKSRSKSGRGDPGSGSEIIQPDAPTGGDGNRLVARVETLTGYGKAAEWAMSLKADLDLWRAGELAWEEMSTKLLLSGPPGTGKTTFARALCNTLQVPLVATSVSNWLEPGYLGDVLKRMAAAFAEAEAMKPSILFVDELDGIGTRRQRGEWAEYTNGIINRALELLDGATRSSGVVVVAATNHPQMIDPALLRSGRLETHIAIPPPDTEALIGILRHHLNADLDAIVASAPAQAAAGPGTAPVEPVIPTAAADQGGTDEPDPGDPEAKRDRQEKPPEASEAACRPTTATPGRAAARATVHHAEGGTV